jgi:hypothetical protein
MSVQIVIASSTVIPNSFYANSIHNVGPQTNWTGAFGANGPSNAQTYIAPVVATGSDAPYCKYRVYKSAIRARYSPTSTTVPFQLIVIPSAIASYGGTVGNSFREQPLVCAGEYPANITATCAEICCEANNPKLLGLQNEAEYRCSDPCSAFYGAYPVNATYFHVLLWSADQTSNVTGQLTVDIDYDVEFFLRNPILSVAV